MKNIPTSIIPKILEIINAYASFKKEKEIVKKVQLNEELMKKIYQRLSLEEIDVYSYTYRELGTDSGISTSLIDDIMNDVTEYFKKQNSEFVNNLISTEKHYKKLKHQFSEHHPEFFEDMKEILKEHQDYTENNKKIAIKKEQDIINLSDRFISFYQYTFFNTIGCKIAWTPFIKSMDLKYNIKNDEKVLFANKIGYSSIQNGQKLTLKEIKVLFKCLDKLVKNVTDEDLDNTNYYIEEYKEIDKKVIATKVVRQTFSRFKKLHNNYLRAIA